MAKCLMENPNVSKNRGRMVYEIEIFTLSGQVSLPIPSV